MRSFLLLKVRINNKEPFVTVSKRPGSIYTKNMGYILRYEKVDDYCSRRVKVGNDEIIVVGIRS